MVADKGTGDGYKLAGDDDVSIIQLAEMFNSSHIFVPERRGERFSSVCESSRARTELGWKPLVSLSAYVDMFKQTLHDSKVLKVTL
jgi:nucleoside-diphosphate-sugar epimerase